MNSNGSKSPLGMVIKIIALILIILIISAVIYGFALINGRAPLPEKAINILAVKANMPPSEKEMMNKAIGVYEILRTSEAGEDIKELRKLAVKGTSGEEAAKQLVSSYSLLSEYEFEEIRQVLEVEPEDFHQGKSIIDSALADYARTGEFSLSDDDKKALETLAGKYGLTEENLQGWSE